ncbi:sodium-extruding oxaloacetate decarboxylase subunit alpha [Deferribacterales bacterium RsTz2092]|nr:pyruvate carboxylase [Deferribacterales bacterium]
MGTKAVKIMETVLRDGHQSLLATRMRLSDMLPVLEAMDEVGYDAIEAWGGATFDTCMRFLNEDPWERLRTLKRHLKKTPIQMLLRGQNILGYSHYADDVVREFVLRSVENGVSRIRIFDALNDVRNMESSFKAAQEAKAHIQGALVYTISPYHKVSDYVQLAKKLADMGSHSIAIKDMSGLISPYTAYELVKALKENVKLPIQMHSHCTSGMASMAYLKAVEAGADIVDTALSPFAESTSQPATESLVAVLKGNERDTGLDSDKLNKLADHFRVVKKDLIKAFELNAAIDIDPKVLSFQLPGGMLSNLLNQMKQQGAEDKYPELLAEMPRVRADLGYPPLVTPTSQMVGTMATFNVMFGRYTTIPEPIKDMVRGKYGRLPGPISDEIRHKIIGDDKVIDYRPANDIKPQFENLKKELADKGYPNAPIEDVLSYAVFPDVALTFFANRAK